MSAQQQTNIKYLFIGNIQNSQIITEYIVAKNNQTEKEVRQIFEKMSKLPDKKFEDRNKLQAKGYNYYFILTQPNIFYLLSTDQNYPDRFAFELFDNLNKEHIALMVTDKGELNANGRKALKNLIDKYQDLKSLSNIANIQSDVNEIKLEMNANIKNMMGNIDDAKELEAQSGRIKDGALLFKTNARELERVTWWANCKLTIIIVSIVVVVVLAIVLPIVLKST
jgi:hypothetical protein